MCIVYDLTQDDSLHRVSDTNLPQHSVIQFLSLQVTNYWLPLIKQCSGGASKSVILAGNKVRRCVLDLQCIIIVGVCTVGVPRLIFPMILKLNLHVFRKSSTLVLRWKQA